MIFWIWTFNLMPLFDLSKSLWFNFQIDRKVWLSYHFELFQRSSGNKSLLFKFSDLLIWILNDNLFFFLFNFIVYYEFRVEIQGCIIRYCQLQFVFDLSTRLKLVSLRGVIMLLLFIIIADFIVNYLRLAFFFGNVLHWRLKIRFKQFTAFLLNVILLWIFFI